MNFTTTTTTIKFFRHKQSINEKIKSSRVEEENQNQNIKKIKNKISVEN